MLTIRISGTRDKPAFKLEVQRALTGFGLKRSRAATPR